LFIQPRPARGEFVARWRAIGRRPALNDTRDEALLSAKANFFLEESKEQLTASPNKGLAGFVFQATGRFTDHHQLRSQRTRADHDSLSRE